ncbi:MAG: ComF family protein [Syntrophobacterales bacterium]|nr:ComF family protein [Syntrophobacterales bacterium]
MINTVPEALKSAFEIFYPLRCAGCGICGFVFCPECIETLRVVEEAFTCPVCGRWTGRKTVCGECIDGKKGFHEGCYGFYFEGRLRDAIHAFKFGGRKDVGKFLVSLINEKITFLAGGLDAIIPIPVTEKRLKERGFNQSFIISEEISRIISRPVLHNALRKRKETKDQLTLSKDERKRNIKGAFELKSIHGLAGKRILLVDDLFTTGYTVREASRILLGGGVERVTVFALARAGS